MASTVLILGAAGRIGQALATAFADAGWVVRAQARKPLPDALATRPQVQAVRCDAHNAEALRTAAKGVHAIIHALNPPYTQWDKLALPLTDAAISLARESGALLMLPGNVYNFGREMPALLSPNTPERGDTPKARIRIETEARMAAELGLNSVVIRAGDFFGGPGRGSWFDMGLASGVAKGKFVYPGGLDMVHAWAYLPDLAQAFVRVAGQHAQLRGHHRLHFAGHAITGQQMREAMEAATGRALRPASLPWGVMRVGSIVMPMWREMLVMRYLWQRAHQLDGNALQALVGSLPHTPLLHAVRASLGELGLLPQSSAPAFSAKARA
ncbi:MAG: NmrA family NAD(P)-binding protein [Cytophagales bacterium]|nr:NmrA family NAD(P)-binding protein [Rhizobacter sp.]